MEGLANRGEESEWQRWRKNRVVERQLLERTTLDVTGTGEENLQGRLKGAAKMRLVLEENRRQRAGRESALEKIVNRGEARELWRGIGATAMEEEQSGGTTTAREDERRWTSLALGKIDRENERISAGRRRGDIERRGRGAYDRQQ